MTTPLTDLTNLLYEAMSVAEAIDPEDLLPGDVVDAIEALEAAGASVPSPGEIVIGGDYLQGHIDTIVSAIDEAAGVVLSIESTIGL